MLMCEVVFCQCCFSGVVNSSFLLVGMVSQLLLVSLFLSWFLFYFVQFSVISVLCGFLLWVIVLRMLCEVVRYIFWFMLRLEFYGCVLLWIIKLCLGCIGLLLSMICLCSVLLLVGIFICVSMLLRVYLEGWLISIFIVLLLLCWQISVMLCVNGGLFSDGSVIRK